MQMVRSNANFWANKSEERAAEDADALATRVERLVAAWMRDTGHWDFDLCVSVVPSGKPGYLAVQSSVRLVAKPLRGEAGGLPVD